MAVPARDQQPAPAVFHLGYRPWLGGLRGLAILLVLAYHVGLVRGGFLGVDVFFVLSGFLITSLLVEEWHGRGAISFKRFYVRRALRLLPGFFTVLVAYYLYMALLRPAELAAYRRELTVAACYLSNWAFYHGTPMPSLAYTWSLSLEEQFYLLWPALLYVLLRSPLSRKGIVALVCAGIIASALVRLALYYRYRAQGLDHGLICARLYTGLDTRADALLVGCLVALLAAWSLLPQSRRALIATRAASLVSMALLGHAIVSKYSLDPLLYKGYLTLVAVMVGIILVRLLTGRSWLVSPILESRALVFVGRLSYSLYLVHLPILAWLRPEPVAMSRAKTALVAGLSLGAAAVLHYGVERPFLGLKDRLQGAPASSRPLPPARCRPAPRRQGRLPDAGRPRFRYHFPLGAPAFFR